MKSSNYNVLFKSQGELFLYNTFSGAFARIHKDKQDLVKAILKRPRNEIFKENEVWVQMCNQGFLITEDFDELGLLEQSLLFDRYSYLSLSVAVLTTYSCNFDCPYCYQKDRESVFLSSETEERLVEFVKSNIAPSLQELYFTWYGGEPLLNFDSIERLSTRFIEIAKDNSLRYYSGLITNGYLLNRQMAEKLNNLQVRTIQITIDGDRSRHNKTRRLLNGGETYDTILDNVADAIDIYENRLILRMNISDQSIESISAFFDDLEARGLKNKVMISAAEILYLNSTNEVKRSKKVFNETEFEIRKILAERGWEMLVDDMGKETTPRRGAYCAADKVSSVVVGADGKLFKCWNDIGYRKNLEIGNLNNLNHHNLLLLNHNNIYFNYDWGKGKCRQCKYLPLCFNSCPSYRYIRNDNRSKRMCKEVIRNLEHNLLQKHNAYISN